MLKAENHNRILTLILWSPRLQLHFIHLKWDFSLCIIKRVNSHSPSCSKFMKNVFLMRINTKHNLTNPICENNVFNLYLDELRQYVKVWTLGLDNLPMTENEHSPQQMQLYYSSNENTNCRRCWSLNTIYLENLQLCGSQWYRWWLLWVLTLVHMPQLLFKDHVVFAQGSWSFCIQLYVWHLCILSLSQKKD